MSGASSTRDMFGPKPPSAPEPAPEPEPEKKPYPDKPLEELEEVERVALHRLMTMMDAGYPMVIAMELAACWEVDLHEACRLLDQGCTPQTAMQILL